MLLQLAEQGDVEAQYAVGKVYKIRAELAEQASDWQAAIEWFSKSAEKGYLHAKFELAVALMEAPKPLYNLDLAVSWMKDAAKENFVDAVNELALFHFEGVGRLEPDCIRALELLMPIIEIYPFAKSNVARVLATCPEVEHRDGSKAVYFAMQSVFLDELNSWKSFEVLAAAFAADGDWLSAELWQKKAVAGEQAESSEEIINSLTIERLKLYQKHCVWIGPYTPFSVEQPDLSPSKRIQWAESSGQSPIDCQG